MILVVCTGNLHRSPLLEAILRQAGITDVSSAGTRAVGGGAPPLIIQAASEHGIDLSGHVSRQVTVAMVESAGLVIAMERNHVAELSVMCPPAFGRIVTLRELRNLMVSNPPRRRGGLAAWAARATAERSTMDVLRASGDLDTPDPIGGTLDTFRASVADIRESAQTVTEGLRLLKHA